MLSRNFLLYLNRLQHRGQETTLSRSNMDPYCRLIDQSDEIPTYTPLGKLKLPPQVTSLDWSWPPISHKF